jgi:hypothetical protein
LLFVEKNKCKENTGGFLTGLKNDKLYSIAKNMTK